MNNELLRHIKKFENENYDGNAHWDGKVSLAVGYGFDLLVRTHDEINGYFNKVGLSPLTETQKEIINGIPKAPQNRTTQLLKDAAVRLNLYVDQSKAIKLLGFLIDNKFEKDVKKYISYGLANNIVYEDLNQGIKNALIDLAYNAGEDIIRKSIRLRTAIERAQNNPVRAHVFWADVYVEYRYFSNADRKKSTGDGIQRRRNNASDKWLKNLLTQGLNREEVQEVIDRLKTHEKRVDNQDDSRIKVIAYDADFDNLITILEAHRNTLPNTASLKSELKTDNHVVTELDHNKVSKSSQTELPTKLPQNSASGMRLHKFISINNENYRLIYSKVKLSLFSPGRADFIVESDRELKGIVIFELGYQLNDLTRIFIGFVESSLTLDKKQQRIFCRELSAVLYTRLTITKRNIKLQELLNHINEKTSLSFSLPKKADYLNKIIPFFYSMSNGYFAMDSIGKVYKIDQYFWQMQKGTLFVGSWSDSRWSEIGNIPVPREFEIVKNLAGSATLPVIPTMMPGALYNQRYVTEVEFEEAKMKLVWNHDPWYRREV